MQLNFRYFFRTRKYLPHRLPFAHSVWRNPCARHLNPSPVCYKHRAKPSPRVIHAYHRTIPIKTNYTCTQNMPQLPTVISVIHVPLFSIHYAYCTNILILSVTTPPPQLYSTHSLHPMIPLVDTHAHLTHPLFRDDLAQVRERAQRAGVTRVLAVSETAEDAEAVILVAQAHDVWVSGAVGVHPERASGLDDVKLMAHLERLSEIAHRHAHSLAAVGEIGLDFSPHVLAAASPASPAVARQRQCTALDFQLRLARTLALPVSLHSRSAGHYVLDRVAAVGSETGGRLVVCMHAYDGRFVYAHRAISQAFAEDLCFSIPPSVLRSPHLHNLVARLPLRCLLLESDAPALSAVKGARAEPAELPRVAALIAAIKGVDEETVRACLYENTMRVFPRMRLPPLADRSLGGGERTQCE